MTRRQGITAGIIAAVLGAAVFVLWACQRKAAYERAAPAWLDPKQPADGIAAELTTLNDGQSWAANRCRPMTAPCTGRTAGRRIRRTYDGCLEESGSSLIRTGAQLELKVRC